jgi:cytochrome c-type biogenesis protein CcsB
MRKILLLLALVAWASPTFADDLDFSALKYLAVQKDGRKKPLDTVAIETVQKLTGKKAFVEPDSGRKMQPMDVLLSMWLQTRDWERTPVILVTHKPLKEMLGLPADQKYFSYSQLAMPQFDKIVQQIAFKSEGQQKPQLTHEEREAENIHQRMNVLTQAVGLDLLAVVPHPNDPKGAWVPITRIGEYYGKDKEAQSQKLLQSLAGAYVQRDPEAFAAASRELRAFLYALSPSVYPAATELRRETRYNSFHPFRKALALYAFAFVWMLATWHVRKPGVYWIGFAAFLAGVLVHGYGFYLRVMISGRPPITNMYESVVWVSFGAAFFALILEAIYRQRYYIVGVAPLSVLMLLLADQFPAVLDASIGPLVPVLRSNYWLSVHVPTITLGYAAFAVAMAVGHIALGYYIFAPQARAKIERLEHLIYRAMQIGVLLLAAGTILGGIWAQEAWGRFWGWDPKETWALIALLSYLIPLHGRLAGWMSNFALSVASVVCFLSVLMAWYGVNFVLGKGLHSYGFGVGGFSYVLGFVALELVFVGVAALRRNRTSVAAEP